jgi:hypothetical protein
MWKTTGRALIFASFTLAFALQLRKKHGKPLGNKNLSQRGKPQSVCINLVFITQVYRDTRSIKHKQVTKFTLSVTIMGRSLPFV